MSDLIDRLAEAQKELDTVMTLLKEKQDQLAEVEAKIAELQATYDNSVREKQKLERNIATTAARLKRAAKLTTALGDEQIRWAETVKVGTCIDLSGEISKPINLLGLGGGGYSLKVRKFKNGWCRKYVSMLVLMMTLL